MSNAMFLGEIHFRVSGCETTEELDQHLDQVLDFLHDDERVMDPDITAALANREVTFTLAVEAEDDIEALTIISGALRSAIHAANGGTPGWENHFRKLASMIRQPEGQLIDA
jgi:hypothetical protein